MSNFPQIVQIGGFKSSLCNAKDFILLITLLPSSLKIKYIASNVWTTSTGKLGTLSLKQFTLKINTPLPPMSLPGRNTEALLSLRMLPTVI